MIREDHPYCSLFRDLYNLTRAVGTEIAAYEKVVGKVEVSVLITPQRSNFAKDCIE
jgi:hypothetical protein